VSKFDTGDSSSAEFEQCKKFGTKCQLVSPAKWHKDHTEVACMKRAKKAPDFKRQAVTSSMAQAAAIAHPKGKRQKAFIDGLVKAMPASCIPFTFMENSYLKEAAGALGIELPGRRALASSILDCVFDESRVKTRDS
jgi:hypothetical protein